MNYKLLSKVFGILLFITAGSMVVGWAATFWETPEPSKQARLGFFVSALITASAGGMLYLLGQGAIAEILRKEAIVIVGFGWLLSGLFGSLPYMLCRPSMDFARAFFESASGFTTTGSTVIADLTTYPNSVLLYRSLSQWLGGLGILVLFIAVLSFLGAGSKALMQHESSLHLGEKNIVRIHDVAVHLWLIYISLTALCFVGLCILGMPLMDSVHHALTTAATGGFSPRNESIGYYDSPVIEAWLMFCMVAGAVNFAFYMAVVSRRWTRVRAEEEARNYVLLILAVIAIMVAGHCRADPERSVLAHLRDIAFPVVSLSTTTGFGTVDYNQWPASSKALLLILMFIGGCAGSTAGGIKMNRVILAFRIGLQELVKTYRPNQVFRIRINDITVEESMRLQTMFYLAIFGALVLLGTLGVTLLQPGLDLTSAVGCIAATITNVGPGFGSVGPVSNFAHLGSPCLIWLALLMITGRLEIFAVLVLFVPSLWRRF